VLKAYSLLVPIALMQGLWLWQRTPTLPAPPGNSGRIGRRGPAPLRLVGVGDSIMAGTGVRDQRHSLTATYARLVHERTACDVEWRTHGVNGATSATILQQVAPRVTRADVYLVSCGVNDATRGVAPARFAENLREILRLLRRKSPQSTIIYGGLPPLDHFPLLPWPLKSVLATRVGEMLAAAADLFQEHERVLCFRFPPSVPADQFASDGFHPAETACEQWARGLLDLWSPNLADASILGRGTRRIFPAYAR
jgi:lysophospholipase L1-like esterase